MQLATANQRPGKRGIPMCIAYVVDLLIDQYTALGHDFQKSYMAPRYLQTQPHVFPRNAERGKSCGPALRRRAPYRSHCP